MVWLAETATAVAAVAAAEEEDKGGEEVEEEAEECKDKGAGDDGANCREEGGWRMMRIVTYMLPFADTPHVRKEHCAVGHQEGASWSVYLYHCSMD